MRLWTLISILSATLAVITLSACQKVASPEDEAAAAAIRWWAEQPSMAGCDTLFISYPGGQNPSPRFLERFATLKTRVLPYSQWMVRSVADTMPNKPWTGGIHLTLSPKRRWAADSMALHYYWHYAPLCGGGGELILARAEGAWTVVQRRDYTIE